MNGMDRQLRDLLEAAVGEPPHRVSAAVVHRRVVRRRVVEFAAAAVAIAAIAVIISVSVGALGHALGRGPGPSTPSHARMVTSRHYGYTEALPPGWRLAKQATRQWNGHGGPGYDRPVVDLFAGPRGVRAWAYATPTRQNLAAYSTAVIRGARAHHLCSPPQISQAIRIGGAPAQLLTMQCAPGSGFLVEIAVTVRNGTGFVFASQPAPGVTGTGQPAAAFRKFLAGIRLPP